jgi:hypothetical protein
VFSTQFAQHSTEGLGTGIALSSCTALTTVRLAGERDHGGAIEAENHDKDITGLKYFKKLLPLLERLHEIGCERDRAGNRDLHFDEYCCWVLRFPFRPIVDSLRACSRRRS